MYCTCKVHVKYMYCSNHSLAADMAGVDSTIVLSWLTGNPRRFKTYVGNRVSSIVDQIPPDRWNHVLGIENPADCASRGVSPSELLEHELWWKGPRLATCRCGASPVLSSNAKSLVTDENTQE